MLISPRVLALAWFSVCLMVAQSLGATTAPQPPVAQTMIILDASGSMVAAVGGQTRIAIARLK